MESIQYKASLDITDDIPGTAMKKPVPGIRTCLCSWELVQKPLLVF